MKDNGNPTVAQRNCVKYASEFTEEENKGVNSLQTSSSTSTQIDYCAKLDGPDDAVAKAKKIKRYKKEKNNFNINQDYSLVFNIEIDISIYKYLYTNILGNVN